MSFYFLFMCSSILVLPVIHETLVKFNRQFQENIELLKNDKVKLVKQIKEFSKRHLTLCDLCESYSNYFIALNLFNSFVTFLFICFELYVILLVVLNQMSLRSLYLLIFTSAWALAQTRYFVALMINSCRIENESSKILEILEHALNSSYYSSKIVKRTIILHQQLSHCRPRVTCAVFELNERFVFDLLALIMSISVVFFQLYGFNK